MELHHNWCMGVGVGLVQDVGSEYVASVIEQHAVREEAIRSASEMFPLLREWAGPSLLDISLSGSYAKGTAISLGTSVDVFVSLDDLGGQSIKDIYWELFHWLAHRRLRPQARNVSLRIESSGVEKKQIAVDVVPGRLRSRSVLESQLSKTARPGAGSEIGTGDHALYWRKKDSWVLTNVAEHLRVVTGSGRAQEIRALKIWRERQRLDFSSFYLELTVIDALRGRRSQELAENVRRVLQYLADDFSRAHVVDPANPHNVISDGYGPEEKRAIAMAARKALGMRRWQQVLW